MSKISFDLQDEAEDGVISTPVDTKLGGNNTFFEFDEDEEEEKEDVIEDEEEEDTIDEDDDDDDDEEDDSDEDDDEEDESEEEEEDEDDEELDEEVKSKAALIEGLNRTGLIEITDEDLESAENIEELVKVKMHGYANQALIAKLNSMGDKERDLAIRLLQGEALELARGAVTVPEYNYSDDDLEDSTDVQKEVIAEALRLQGRTDKEIKRNLKAIDEDELLDEAKEAKEFLAKYTQDTKANLSKKSKEEAEARKRKEEEYWQGVYNELDKRFENSEAFIPGVKIPKTTKEAIKSKAPDVLRKVNSNLGQYLYALTMLDHYGILDGDFSKVQKLSESDITKKVAKKLKETKSKRTTGKAKKKRNTTGKPKITF